MDIQARIPQTAEELRKAAEAGKKVIYKLKEHRVSTESLTFLFSIAIGLLGVLPDLEYPFKGIGNVCFGFGCCFFSPIIIKRVLVEEDDGDSIVPYILEFFFIPLGLASTMFGVCAVCIGIEFWTGVATTACRRCP